MDRRLLPKQKAFVEYYAACGNATEAAKQAGYSEKYVRQNAPKLLHNTAIKTALADLTAKVGDKRIADVVERQAYWTALMRGEIRGAPSVFRPCGAQTRGISLGITFFSVFS